MTGNARMLTGRMRYIPRLKTLQVKTRMVYQAAAEYRDLLASTGREPDTEPEEDFVPPNSCGRRLTVLRQPPAPDAPPDLTAQLQEERGPARETMLPPTTMKQALDVINDLRLRNLRLQTQLLRAGTEPMRESYESISLQRTRGRGSHKELAMVHATRLNKLEKLEAGVERVFSPIQIAVLCGTKSRSSVKKWPEADMRKAVELRAMCSRKVFEFVRGPLGLPLPCINTLEIGCKRYPDLEEELKRALGAPAPRCPTCRRNRDDATTEAERRSYDPRPKRPKKELKGKRKSAQAVAHAVALARRTGTAVGESGDHGSPGKGRTSWKFVQDAEPKLEPKTEPESEHPLMGDASYWGNDAPVQATAEHSEDDEDYEDEDYEGEDDGGQYEDYEGEQDDDGEQDLIARLADTETRRKIAQRGKWL